MRTLAHKGIEGNEISDTYAKWAADGYVYRVGKVYLREVSLAHLSRKTAEAKTEHQGLDPATCQG